MTYFQTEKKYKFFCIINIFWKYKDISPEQIFNVDEKTFTKVYRVKITISIPLKNEDNLEDFTLGEVKKISLRGKKIIYNYNLKTI